MSHLIAEVLARFLYLMCGVSLVLINPQWTGVEGSKLTIFILLVIAVVLDLLGGAR